MRPSSLGKASSRGFSLVEIVIAIALISFSLVAIIGLFSIGLNQSRDSADETNLALMTRHALSWCRNVPFSQLPVPTSNIPKALAATFYYSNTGVALPYHDGESIPQEAYYACYVTATYPTPSPNFRPLQLTFEWPLIAPEANRQKSVVLASRANGE